LIRELTSFFGQLENQKAGKFTESIIEKGDILLVKGSQAMRMERVTKELMNEPDKADMLLVRQEPEWLAKK